MRLSQIVYCSRATRPFTGEEIRELGRRSGMKNGPRAVTGLLLYSAGHFIQLIEGDHAVITEIMLEISRDSRHTDIALLHVGPARRRMFSRWRMGVLDLREAAPLDRERMAALLQEPDAPDAGMALLNVFRDFRAQLPADEGVVATADC